MSSLESSVTLEDVFSVVEAKRVPLAPELAGYLTLEVADGSQATGGEVDPRTVYISEEGTVALVRPKKEAPAGDAETSVRAILAKLLEASGSATPALTASARRRAGAGLPALVAELEAALIPVNRAAGRRALARLAREVKRVTLGVGRNASVPAPANRPLPPRDGLPASAPRGGVRESAPDEVMSGPDAPPGPRGSFASFSDEALTAKRTNQLPDLQMPAAGAPDAPRAVHPAMGLTPPPHPGAPAPAPPAPAPPGASPALPPSAPMRAAPPQPARAPGPPVPARGSAALPPPPQRAGAAGPVVGPPPRGKSVPAGSPAGGATGAADKAEIDKLFGGDEVESLLSTFEVSSVGEKQLRTDLKAIAGLDPTPGPPDATTLAELTKDVGKGLPKSERPESDGVEALLALADVSGPLAAPLPPPGFGVKSDEAPLLPPASVASPREYEREPAAPMPPLAPLAPPVPLGPISPAPPETSNALAAPPPPPAAPPAVDPGLRRPATPRAAAPPAASTVGHRKKLGAGQSPAATTSRGPTSARGASTTGAGFRQPRAPRTGLAMLVLTLFVLVAGGIAVWMFKPAFFTGKKRPVVHAPASAPSAAPAAPRCKVALVVTDVPVNAEILLRMGQAPLDVERMPVGTRLEFVATAEGYAPRRAVIKAESPWDKTPDGKPRIDVPIQLDPTKAKAGTVDPWPAAEPGSQVGGSGAPGSVHVVSNVRGAEVWLLAGLGPEARIEQLRCDGDIDVLLAGPPQLRKRLHVGQSEIQAATADAQGNREISVTAK